VIPEHLIEQIKDANDIVDVISSYISLQRKGLNLWANCPFHDEKTPSFSVSPSKQIYHCFGCGVGGNVLNFVMEYSKLSFPEALRELAARAGIEIPDDPDDKKDRSEVQTLFDLHSWAARLYEEELFKPPGKNALNYLLKRGLTEKTIRELHIGWAPEGWDFLLRSVKNKQNASQLLLKAGLAMQREGGSGYYDRFRERIIFPIQDPKGNTVGFGGRIISDSQEAKYLNSPETPVYHKSKVLYGLPRAVSAMRKLKSALLVEGYMDAVQLIQAGFEHVVAGSGTAFTPDQAKLLKRYTPEAILCYDSDTAGQNAALKTALLLSGEKLNVKILQLPAGEDPDSFVKKHGPQALQTELDRAVDIFELLRQTLSSDAMSPSEQSDLLSKITEQARTWRDTVYQELFLTRLADIFKIRPEGLQAQLRKGSRPLEKTISIPGEENRYIKFKDRVEASQFEIIQLLLTQDPLIRKAALKYLSEDVFNHKGYAKAASELLRVLSDQPEIRAEEIPPLIQDEKVRRFIYRLIFDLDSQIEPRRAFLDCMREIETGYLRAQLRILEDRQRENDREGRFDPDINREITEFTDRLKELPLVYTPELFEDL